MSRNGTGTYTLPAGNPVVTGTTISSTWANNTLSDIATALTQSLAKDGQTVPTANIPMGSFKITGLGAPTTAGDALAYGSSLGAVTATTGTFSGNVQMASANGGQLAGLRNSIINGDMAIWQRGTAAITSAVNGTFSADRFYFRSSYTGGTTTITQSTGPSQNLRFSTRVTHATATATVVTGQYYALRQVIEKSVARMFGNASNVTVSFWYRSNRTGSHACVFDAGLTGTGFTGTTTAGSSTFTVNVADTWEYKSLTFPLVITGNGTNAENIAGALLTIGFADELLTTFSSISVGNYFDITGVQLEVGPVATPFEQRPIGMELALCQRYYAFYVAVGSSRSTTISNCYVNAPVPMRAVPSTFVISAVTLEGIGNPTGQSSVTTGSFSYFFRIETTYSALGAAGNPCTQSITASAEL